MKLTEALRWNKWQKNGRRPIKPDVRLGYAKEVRPLVLRNYVAQTSRDRSDVVCITQMMEMMSCLKTAEFDQGRCQSEIKSFQQCYTDFLSVKKELKARSTSQVPIPGQSKFTFEQLNALLARWPHPK